MAKTLNIIILVGLIISLLASMTTLGLVSNIDTEQKIIDNSQIIKQTIDKTITIEGEEGTEGDRGTRGYSGDDGEQGIQGIIGLSGIDGVDGNDGNDGIDGTQGIQGIQGIIGDAGIDGNDGDIGIQGDIGLQGIQGIQGEQGIPGENITNDDFLLFQEIIIWCAEVYPLNGPDTLSRIDYPVYQPTEDYIFLGECLLHQLS